MKFLIIDDSTVARLLVKYELEPFLSENDLVLEASEGVEGIELYKKHNPDITFVDLTMPKMGGIEIIDKIKEFDPDAYLIVLTADIQKVVKTKAYDAGIVKYLNKPLKKATIEEILQDKGE